ncbi:MAG: cupin domain-containing protein [Tahibacter sp.]
MSSLPIEVRATAGLPLGMPADVFLRDYWQKRPLLIRTAFPAFRAPLAPEDLAGLACEEAALSRLIVRDAKRDRWSVRSGPFTDEDFAQLPKSHWTLLVQDVDKWDADVNRLIDSFDFLPRWRVDDVMISYAVDGGGVGAHVDHYDVFLLQGLGRRHWTIDDRADAPTAFRDDAELKLLAQFSPTHAWTLEVGDMLYLPPGVPHDGVAEGPCMTFSIGMRAPSVAEMILDLAESIAEPLAEELRYSDPDLRPSLDPNEIGADALHRVSAALTTLRTLDDAAIGDWFGRYVTRYRSAQTIAPPNKIHDAKMLQSLFDAKGGLVRHPFARMAYAREGKQARLFSDGQRWSCSLAFAQLICDQREIAAPLLTDLGLKDRDALLGLINAGHLVPVKPRKRKTT